MTALAFNLAQWNERLAARTCDLCGRYVGAGDPCGCGPCRTCDGDGFVLSVNRSRGPSAEWDYDDVPCSDCDGAA